MFAGTTGVNPLVATSVLRLKAAAVGLLSLPNTFAAEATAAAEQATEAYETTPIIEDFLVNESVYSQEDGEIQLTLAPSYFTGGDEGDGKLTQAGFEYGLSDQLQAEATLTVWLDRDLLENGRTESRSGLGDLELGLKYTFAKHAAIGLQIAVGMDFTAPLGDVDKGLGEGFWIYEPFLIVSKDLGEANVTLNLSYGLRSSDKPVDKEEPDTDELGVSLGLVRAFGPVWRGTLEWTWESDELSDRGSESEGYVTPGVIYKGVESFELGVGVSLGLTDDSADWGVLGALSYEF